MDCILTDNEIRPKIGYYYTDCRLFHGVVYYSNDQPQSEDDGYLF